MKADVLFIHPGGQRKIYQGLSRGLTAIAPPVWIALLAQAVREKGFAPAVYDANLEGWGEETAAALLEQHRPRLAVIMVYGHHPSASTQTMPAAGAIARSLKESAPDLPVAMGGLHPTVLPERTLREEAADYVIAGEGVYTIPALVEYLRGTRDLSRVPGLWYRSGSAASATPPAPAAEDLDRLLPDYAWDLLPELGRYRAHNMHCFQDFSRSRKDDFSDVRSPYAVLYTSLGCPFACDYCCINALAGRRGVRYWSLPRVLSWIDRLVQRHGVRNIRLDDELFILDPERVERFCDGVIERGYDLNLWVYGRADTVPDRLLDLLRRAGVTWICLGIETASDRVRRDVHKTISGDIRRAVRAIQDRGISVLGNFLFGLPEDDRATLEETLALALDLKCEFVNFYTLRAYPGSPLYERARLEPGHLPPGWEGFSQHGYDAQPLPTRHLSAAEVLRFREEAFRRYFQDEGYLDAVEKKFGIRVRQHILEMLGISLPRRLLERPA